jgi:hypothetical protein
MSRIFNSKGIAITDAQGRPRVKPDYHCPECKVDVGPPTSDPPVMRCPKCEIRLTLVKIIGNGVTFLHYRRK